VLLKDKVLHVLGGLVVRHGAAYAHERTKRVMVGKTWRLPGERSVGRVERQLAREGRLERRLLKPGDLLPNGKKAEKQIVVVRVRSRQEKRNNDRARRKREKRDARAPAPVRVASTPGPAAPTTAAPLEKVERRVTIHELPHHVQEAIARILGPPTRPR
jgi:hypothetical protein